MGKFLVAGIVQRETIVKVEKIPIEYAYITGKTNTIFNSTGGDAYNESLALKCPPQAGEYTYGGGILR